MQDVKKQMVNGQTKQSSRIERKRQQEMELLKFMVGIYCRGMHRTKSKQLCPHCSELLEYALLRTEKCPFMETKTFCSACRIHCYSGEKQQEIRMVMRYAGPRMLLVHPILAVRHAKETIGAKKREKKNNKRLI